MNKKHQLHIELEESEYQMLLRQRDFLKYNSVSDVIRAYIHSGHCYRFDYSGFYEFSTQVARIGNNINQIAHVANETLSISAEQIESLKDMMDRIEKIVRSASKEQAKIVEFKKGEDISGEIYGSYENHKNKE